MERESKKNPTLTITIHPLDLSAHSTEPPDPDSSHPLLHTTHPLHSATFILPCNRYAIENSLRFAVDYATRNKGGSEHEGPVAEVDCVEDDGWRVRVSIARLTSTAQAPVPGRRSAAEESAAWVGCHAARM
eukprot:361399-Chlamydomonas_euryale.AAC.4